MCCSARKSQRLGLGRGHRWRLGTGCDGGLPHLGGASGGEKSVLPGVSVLLLPGNGNLMYPDLRELVPFLFLFHSHLW